MECCCTPQAKISITENSVTLREHRPADKLHPTMQHAYTRNCFCLSGPQMLASNSCTVDDTRCLAVKCLQSPTIIVAKMVIRNINQVCPPFNIYQLLAGLMSINTGSCTCNTLIYYGTTTCSREVWPSRNLSSSLDR